MLPIRSKAAAGGDIKGSREEMVSISNRVAETAIRVLVAFARKLETSLDVRKSCYCEILHGLLAQAIAGRVDNGL